MLIIIDVTRCTTNVPSQQHGGHFAATLGVLQHSRRLKCELSDVHISNPGPDNLREIKQDDDGLPSLLELSPLCESESPVEYSSTSGRPRLTRYRRICASRLANMTCTQQTRVRVQDR